MEVVKVSVLPSVSALHYPSWDTAKLVHLVSSIVCLVVFDVVVVLYLSECFMAKHAGYGMKVAFRSLKRCS